MKDAGRVLDVAVEEARLLAVAAVALRRSVATTLTVEAMLWVRALMRQGGQAGWRASRISDSMAFRRRTPELLAASMLAQASAMVASSVSSTGLSKFSVEVGLRVEEVPHLGTLDMQARLINATRG